MSLADGRTVGVPVGYYLASYDPEGNDGQGMASWTPHRGEAMTFATARDALSCLRAVPNNRPVRPDGRPNRPLTMFAVMFD